MRISFKRLYQPFNTVRAASKKIEYFGRKKSAQLYAVHRARADLCQLIDDAENQMQPHILLANDCQIFENLVSSSHREGKSDTDWTIETEANTDGNPENFYFTKEVF